MFHQKNINIVIISTIIASITILSSCQNQTTPILPGNKPMMIGSGSPPDEFFAYSDAVQLYDTTNVYGEIDFSEDYYDYINQNNQIEPMLFSGVTAYFWDNLENEDVDSIFLPINAISINNVSLMETGKPHNFYGSAGPIYYAGSNHISIQPNQYIPAFDTNISLLPVVRFTNIYSGDTIYTNSDTQLNWTGSSNGFGHIIIQQLTDDEQPIGSEIYSVAGYIKNDGQFIIKAGDLSEFPEGKYGISYGRYEPYFATLSNGKRIVITDASSHTVFVYLKH